MRCTSAFTLRIQPGRPRRTLRPDSDSVLSMTYVATAGLLRRSRAGQRSAEDPTGASRLAAFRNIYTDEETFPPRPWGAANRGACCAAPAPTPRTRRARAALA